jgi:hypothetical protein
VKYFHYSRTKNLVDSKILTFSTYLCDVLEEVTVIFNEDSCRHYHDLFFGKIRDEMQNIDFDIDCLRFIL